MVENNLYNNYESNVDIQIYEYGNEQNNIKISIVKVWDIDEQVSLHMQTRILSHYLNWIKNNRPNESFIKFLNYEKEYDNLLVFKKTIFKIDIVNGRIVDLESNIIAEIDGMLTFNNVVLYIKGMEFWINNREDPIHQYYCI